MTCRALSGSSTMRWLSTTVLTPDRPRVHERARSTVTCTCFASGADASTGLTTGLLPTCSTMPGLRECAEAGAPPRAGTVRAAGSAANTRPSHSTRWCADPVSCCVAVTVTPGSTAPLSSLAVPLMPAVACAQAGRQRGRARPQQCRTEDQSSCRSPTPLQALERDRALAVPPENVCNTGP